MIYFDSSAMIRAYSLRQVPKGVTRSHSLAEFYSTLTGPGLKSILNGRTVIATLPPVLAAQAAQKTFAKMTFRDLTDKEAMEALASAAEANEFGRNIHDWMHCQAAELAECGKVATLNAKDFARMTSIKLIPPEEAF